MIELDRDITQAINGFSGAYPDLDHALLLITTWGVPILVCIVTLQWWTTRARLHTRHVLLSAGLSFLGGLALNQAILLLVQRARPYESGLTHVLVARSADPSFPSDHATAAFAIAAAFLLHAMPRRGLLFLTAALMVGLSRVYVGTHYVSDVLGGAATGFIAAALIRLLYREGTRVDRLVTQIL